MIGFHFFLSSLYLWTSHTNLCLKSQPNPLVNPQGRVPPEALANLAKVNGIMFELVNGFDTAVEITALNFFSPLKAVYNGPLDNPNNLFLYPDLYDIPSPNELQVQLYKLDGSFVGFEDKPDDWTLVVEEELDFGTLQRSESVTNLCGDLVCGQTRCFNPESGTCNSEYKIPLTLRLARSQYFEMEPGETVSLFLFTEAEIYVEDRDAVVTGKSVFVLFCRVLSSTLST